jgi:hypothetical protein
MQILEIVLYNNDGSERRVLPFNTGKVNIISGKSSTGKSALIDIVDYCLGRGSCYIPRNIRKAVSWFGIKLAFETSEIFIARKNPPFGAKTTTEAFIIEGESIKSPLTAPKESNSNSEDIEEVLASKLGINQVTFIPGKNQTRDIFQVSLRHALNYSFQPQGIISDKDTLFPAVKDTWQRNDLKNTLPYFLGAMNENKINLLNQKEILEKTLRKKKAELQENEKIKGEGFSRGLSLLMECQNIGLIDSNSKLPRCLNEIHDLLSSTLHKKPTFEMELSNSTEINKLFAENEDIKYAIKKINDEKEAINFRLEIIYY